MAALQSFPDDYLFFGNKQSQLVQIGNAVPPYVARAVGIALQDEILK
jgi:DNA (cytosine-5)-methyltransferase 1